MYLERIQNDIDILSFTVFQLLQDLDLMHGNLDALILRFCIDFVVLGVYIDDFKSNDTVVNLIPAEAKLGTCGDRKTLTAGMPKHEVPTGGPESFASREQLTL